MFIESLNSSPECVPQAKIQPPLPREWNKEDEAKLGFLFILFTNPLVQGKRYSAENTKYTISRQLQDPSNILVILLTIMVADGTVFRLFIAK